MRAQIKLALRVLARRKVFTAISLVGITLTLVVLVVLSAIADNLFHAAKPQSNLDRMLFVFTTGQYGPSNSDMSQPGFGFAKHTVRDLPGAERVTLFTQAGEAPVYSGGSRMAVDWRRVDAEYWRVHDFAFVEGSQFSDAEAEAGSPVAVISARLAKTLFGSSRNVIGKSVNISGRMHRVTGVAEDVPSARTTASADIWTPLGPPPAEQRDSLLGELNIIVLAKSEAEIPAIQAEFRRRVANYPISDPKTYKEVRSGLDTNFHALARQLTDGAFGDRSGAILIGICSAVMFLFMLLPALNLITLNLSRTLERAPEIGVRRAFGAPRRALVRQFVFENVVLTVIGGIASFILAVIVLRMIEASGLFPSAQFEVNLRVFAYGMVFAVLFGILSGAWPAWRMARLNPVDALRGGAL